jgi:hypothetical protein
MRRANRGDGELVEVDVVAELDDAEKNSDEIRRSEATAMVALSGRARMRLELSVAFISLLSRPS